MPTPGRFVLLLDILGFKQMLCARSAQQVCAIVEDVLKECDNWTESDGNDFDTIHFSDTIVLYTRQDGAYKEWYDDLVFVGARVCNRLLAQGVPVRGSMAFGDFLTKKSGRHLVYLGQAFVEAYEAQDKKPYLGFSVSSELWRGLMGTKKYLVDSGQGVPLSDGTFWINPLTEFDDINKARIEDKIREVFHGREDGSGYLKGELLAFRFIVDEAAKLAATPRVPPKVIKKYTNTVKYLRRTLGPDLYALAEELSAVDQIHESSWPLA